jgi:DNA-binding MltR family transcriptional regulator
MTVKSADLQGFINEFSTESDRATAILGAAILDEKLYQLLTAFLIDDAKEVPLLLDNEQPLGTFGSRIHGAYCMGLLSRTLFDTLIVIKSIRNSFAHRLRGLSFADEGIAKECEKLRVLTNIPEEACNRPRDAFLSATMSAQTEIWTMKASVEAAARRCKVPVWTLLFEHRAGQHRG